MKILSLVFAIALAACGSSKPAPGSNGGGGSGGSDSGSATQQAGACIKTGCSGTICAEPGGDVMSTCEYKNEYACYKTATCEKQADGKCGWTQTPQLTSCLASPPAP